MPMIRWKLYTVYPYNAYNTVNIIFVFVKQKQINSQPTNTFFYHTESPSLPESPEPRSSKQHNQKEDFTSRVGATTKHGNMKSIRWTKYAFTHWLESRATFWIFSKKHVKMRLAYPLHEKNRASMKFCMIQLPVKNIWVWSNFCRTPCLANVGNSHVLNMLGQTQNWSLKRPILQDTCHMLIERKSFIQSTLWKEYSPHEKAPHQYFPPPSNTWHPLDFPGWFIESQPNWDKVVGLRKTSLTNWMNHLKLTQSSWFIVSLLG